MLVGQGRSAPTPLVSLGGSRIRRVIERLGDEDVAEIERNARFGAIAAALGDDPVRMDQLADIALGAQEVLEDRLALAEPPLGAALR